MLLRELLADSLRLMELEARPEDRLALALGWFSETITREDGLNHAAIATGVPGADEWPRAIKERRAAIQKAMEANGVRKLEHFPDEGQLARKHDRASEDWSHRLYSEMVHRPDLAGMFRTRIPETNTFHVYLRNGDPELLAAALTAAMISALHAHLAVARMFSWDETINPAEAMLEEANAIFPDDAVDPG